MRSPYGMIAATMALAMAATIAGCKDDEPPKTVEDIEVGTPMYNVINILMATGNDVTVVGGAPHPYFEDARNAVIRVNGGVDLELYEFSSPEDLEKATAGIPADASTIGGKSVEWPAPPHLFKTSKVVVIYMGSDPDNVRRLGGTLGEPFAGK